MAGRGPILKGPQDATLIETIWHMMLGRDDQDDTPGSCLRFQTMKELKLALWPYG